MKKNYFYILVFLLVSNFAHAGWNPSVISVNTYELKVKDKKAPYTFDDFKEKKVFFSGEKVYSFAKFKTGNKKTVEALNFIYLKDDPLKKFIDKKISILKKLDKKVLVTPSIFTPKVQQTQEFIVGAAGENEIDFNSNPPEVESYVKSNFTILKLDLDIDTKNQTGDNYFTLKFDPSFDSKEEEEGEGKSKIIYVNNIDKDGDEVPDFMDGWDCQKSQIKKLTFERGSRKSNEKDQFVPIVLNTSGFSQFEKARIKIIYPESPPESMKMSDKKKKFDHKPEYGTRTVEIKEIHSEVGKIRIWKKDGSIEREVSNKLKKSDFIRANKIYTFDELGISKGPITIFYIEGINASKNWSDIHIKFELSIDEGKTWIDHDTVKATCIMSNFYTACVRQFQLEKLAGRVVFTPDYSSPKKTWDGLFDSHAYTEKYGELADYLKKHTGINKIDDYWHDRDAVLGHGFVFFEYDGPDLKNDLSKNCTKAEYNKYYLGKTGSGGSMWVAGDSRKNHQHELQWWDVCDYEILYTFKPSKKLVLKTGYTLNYKRLSKVFDTFNEEERYKPKNFVLQIDKSKNDWGCLSNVGLGMKDHDIDGRMEKCYTKLLMPTTFNKEVFDLVDLCKWLIGRKNMTFNEFKKFSKAISKANDGVKWNTSPDLYKQGGLVDLLYEAMKKPLERATKKEIEKSFFEERVNPRSKPLLHYYDPGLYPDVFGESSNDIFDTKE